MPQLILRVHHHLTGLYYSRTWLSPSPAGSAACIALCLAVLIVVANRRRTTNWIWSVALVFLALWQGSIAAAQVSNKFIFVRLALFFGAIAVASMFMLKEVIATSKKPVLVHLWNIRYVWMCLPLYGLMFTSWFSSPASSGPEHLSVLASFLNLLSICSGCFLVQRMFALIRRQEVTGFRALELNALVGLACACFGTSIVSTALGRAGGLVYLRWFAPSITVVGLLLFTLFLIRTQLIDTYDLRQSLWLWLVRGIGCIFMSLVLLAFASKFELTATVRALAYVVVLTLVLMVSPVFERQFRLLVDRRFASAGFQEAQRVVSAETEKNVLFVDLHAQYVEILKQWSGGSSDVFLSEGVLTAVWPVSSMPEALVLILNQRGWTAPELLESDDVVESSVYGYMLQNQIGAAVGYVSPAGEKLLSCFKSRESERPFLHRELREAHELLRQMQIGLSFARMRQAQRGDDRLNFYGRYAPQFAHELRNGLYLQTQLLRAIANGRGDSVLPSDAKAGLEKVEQVDRLCRHFFSAGAVFRQPLREIRIHDVLRPIVDKAQAQIGPSVEVVLRVDAPNELEVVANPDMLGIALQNLLLNASEALAGVSGPRRIELSASVQFERVRMLLRDNGPGMPPDRVRDPFSPGRSQKKGGMGLGLSIVRDCIEAMGGTIGLRPPSGTGACFEITLVCRSRGRIDSLPRRSFLPTGQSSVPAV